MEKTKNSREKKPETSYNIFQKKYWRKLFLINFPKLRIPVKSIVKKDNNSLYTLERYTKDGHFAVIIDNKTKNTFFENIENVYKA